MIEILTHHSFALLLFHNVITTHSRAIAATRAASFARSLETNLRTTLE